MGVLCFEEPHNIIFRPYLVFAGTFSLLFSVFLLFVVIGWPGNPSDCIYEEPHNGCYCEAINLQDVEDGNPGVRQPVNTWFNLLVVLASAFVAWRMSEDRKQLFLRTAGQGEQSIDSTHEPTASSLSVVEDVTNVDVSVAPGTTSSGHKEEASSPRNVMMSANLIADWFVLTMVLFSLGKMYFHGSLTVWGTYFDCVGSTFFYAYPPWYTIRRINHSDPVFWLGYMGTIALITCAQLLFGSLMAVYILVPFYFLMEVYMGAIKGVFFMGTCRSVTIWMLAFSMMLLAAFFWRTSRTGRIMCDPDSFWQLHGLVWHPLANVIMVLLYLYWRLGDDDGDLATNMEGEQWQLRQ